MIAGNITAAFRCTFHANFLPCSTLSRLTLKAEILPVPMVRAVFTIVETNVNAATFCQTGLTKLDGTMMRRAPLLCGAVIMMTPQTFILTLK